MFWFLTPQSIFNTNPFHCFPNQTRGVVGTIIKKLDPNGVELQKHRLLKCRVFHTPGPNHIWSSDGHDKLKKFGVSLYAFIDAWSRKILGIFVHTTNNDPFQIGYYYLQVVKAAGGIPQKTTTDCGTETIQMAGHQINFKNMFGQVPISEALKSHVYTKSTHNQNIECLWSQLMRQHNSNLIDQLYSSIETGIYNTEDPIQK